jgi:hypothetical protein
MHQRELAEKKEEEEWDYWFNRLRPMTKPKQTWWEKQLAKEENSSSSREEEVEDNSAKGDSNPGSGSGNPESGNYNPCGKEDQRVEELTWMDVNMVFMILLSFVHQRKMLRSWHWVLDVPCLKNRRIRERT